MIRRLSIERNATLVRMAPIYLVACVSQKLGRRSRAAELYRSDWFRKARTYVEETGSPWFILSAAHGLVRPHRHLDPYDATLRDLSAVGRRLWGEMTVRQLRRATGPRHPGPIIFWPDGCIANPCSTSRAIAPSFPWKAWASASRKLGSLRKSPPAASALGTPHD